jgi:peptidoglycan/xylan/chitin deacetylase (PgdA/CDA1 family)
MNFTKMVILFILFLLSLFAIAFLFPPRWLISFLSPKICPEAIYYIKTNEPIVALTIDDSPDNSSANTTKNILKILAKNKVKATFFLIGSQIKKNSEIVNQIIKDGHEIGNHLTKDEPSIQLGAQFESELLKAETILSEFSQPVWLRPGGGWCNYDMVEVAKKHNYSIALGSVWSYDTHIPSSNFASWFILNNVRPGSIIVLHDSGKEGMRGKRTVATLSKILPKLENRGYRFVTLSELKSYQD